MSSAEILLLATRAVRGQRGRPLRRPRPDAADRARPPSGRGDGARARRRGRPRAPSSPAICRARCRPPSRSARRPGIAMRTTPALRERSVGVFTGHDLRRGRGRAPRHLPRDDAARPRRLPARGRDPRATASRASAPSSTRPSRASRRGRTLFVSHAFTLNLLLRRVLGLADSPSVFFRTDNCALHRLKRAPTGFWNVEALNDRRHLVEIAIGGDS